MKHNTEPHVYTACPDCDDVQNDCCPYCRGTDSYCPICDCPADDCEFAFDDEGHGFEAEDFEPPF